MEATDVTVQRAAGSFNVDAAGEAQVVHMLTQMVDDGEPQGALRVTVDAHLLLCAGVTEV